MDLNHLDPNGNARMCDVSKKEITVWDENDLGIRPEDCGHHASPTKVFRSFTPPPKGKGEMLSGTVNEMAQTLVSRLMEKHIL